MPVSERRNLSRRTLACLLTLCLAGEPLAASLSPGAAGPFRPGGLTPAGGLSWAAALAGNDGRLLALSAAPGRAPRVICLEDAHDDPGAQDALRRLLGRLAAAGYRRI